MTRYLRTRPLLETTEIEQGPRVAEATDMACLGFAEFISKRALVAMAITEYRCLTRDLRRANGEATA